MPLDPKDRATLDRFVAELRGLHGEELLAVVLTGEAASPAYRPRRSPLTTVVVLRAVSPAALRRTRMPLRAWRRRRIPTPLLMDPPWIESSRDAFPLEFLEIRDRHTLLHGARDPFADLTVHLPHLRLAVEEQLRGKLLHLWAAYLDTAGSQRRLRALLLETAPGFELVLRGLLQLAGGAAGGSDLDALEGRLGVPLLALRRLEAARQGREPLRAGELEDLFEAYLAEVRELVGRIEGR